MSRFQHPMKFLDEAKIYVKSGAGGAGSVSFRREKFIEFGGPDGGDGGRGGDVVALCVHGLNTLIDYRYQQHFKAKTGGHGMGQNRAGGKGADAVLKVPVGTEIYDADSETLIADLTEVGQSVRIAQGRQRRLRQCAFQILDQSRPAPRQPRRAGAGAHADPAAEADRRRRPRRPAQRRQIDLSRRQSRPPSRRSPTIPSRRSRRSSASSPATGANSCSPIFPASSKARMKAHGLGDRFLGHVERCRVLLHLVDAGSEHAGKAYKTVRHEIEAYGAGLAEKPEIVALSKIDTVDAETLKTQTGAAETRGEAHAARAVLRDAARTCRRSCARCRKRSTPSARSTNAAPAKAAEWRP